MEDNKCEKCGQHIKEFEDNKISKRQMQAYEDIKQSGKTNMMAITMVQTIAINDYDVYLKKEDVMYIMENYEKLINGYKIKSKVKGFSVKIK
jgi:hypothetical protein